MTGPGLFFTLCLAAAPASAQFQVFSVEPAAEVPVPATLDLGVTNQTDRITRQFRLRNVSASPAAVRRLEVAGTGFAFAGPVALPQTVAPGGAIDFTVTFHSASEGGFSAALRSEGISILLTARVAAELTVALATPGGPFPLATGATVGFGAVEKGSASTVSLILRNLTSREQTISPVAVMGDEFRAAGALPAGILAPLAEATFEIRFQPAAAGPRRGAVTVGGRGFVLSGTGVEPPLPAPALSLTPARPGSGQQARIAVALSEASRTVGTGVVTLDFLPQAAGVTDPAIVFSNGTRTAAFSVEPGDRSARFGQYDSIAFQTGSTAGALTVSVRLGGATARQTVEIAAAPPAIGSVETARTANGLEVRLSGYDNTRTAGPLAFTFYDRAGQALAAPVRIDASGDFGRFFQASDAGGVFLLKAVFPVSGDVSMVDAVEAELSNAAGPVRTARTKF